MLLDDYAVILEKTVENIRSTQREKIAACADIAARVIAGDGLIYVFGCGHSHILAEETFYRAGGLACVAPVFYEPLMLHESASLSSTLEKQEGLAEKVLAECPISDRDMLICVSNSGVNAVPVEFAKLVGDRGIPVVGVSSDEYLTQTPHNAPGKHLQDVCNICINNFAPHGDACLFPEGLNAGITPVSTVAGTYILNSILAEAVERLSRMGVSAPVYTSGNVPGGAEKNVEMIAYYKPRIPSL